MSKLIADRETLRSRVDVPYLIAAKPYNSETKKKYEA